MMRNRPVWQSWWRRAFAALLLCGLALPASAADVCPLLRAQTQSPIVSTRIAAVACNEHQYWYRPFISREGFLAGSRVREAEGARLANGEEGWRRVARYWVEGGTLQQAMGRPGASECLYAIGAAYPSPSCRAFIVDVPWSAAFVSYVMRQAAVPGFHGSPSHVAYVRDAFRNPQGSAFRVNDPRSTRPAAGDLLCYVRVASRVFGFNDLAAMLSSSDEGLNMHCDVVVAINPGNDRTAYLVGGNVLDGVTMRMLPLSGSGQFQALSMRGTEDSSCSPDMPANCDGNRQDWAIMLELRPPEELAQLPPAPSSPGAGGAMPQQQCCVNCVLGSGIPRCGTQQPAPVWQQQRP